MYKILIIEDDKSIREELTFTLNQNGYEAVNIEQFLNIEEQIKMYNPHLILLDINLPTEDGFKICMKIRHFSDIPIIFVTSRTTDMDELQSISLGGDDFITKPYHIPILLARIAALLKRAYKDSLNSALLSHQGIILDLEAGLISYQGKQAELTKNELKIIAYLFRNIGRIVSRAELIDYLWDNQLFIDDNTLSVNITRIRNKLEQIGIQKLIETKHRLGYRILLLPL